MPFDRTSPHSETKEYIVSPTSEVNSLLLLVIVILVNLLLIAPGEQVNYWLVHFIHRLP